MLNPIMTQIPTELQSYNQFVVWKAKPKDNGKIDKIPVNPKTGDNAKSNDPDTWADFATAARAYRDSGGKYAGIGFVLTESDPFYAGDLDTCIDSGTGEIEPWALDIIRQLNTYCEVSPSGTGARILGRGILNGLKGRKKGKIEVYDQGRFVTLTGHHLGSSPATIEDRQQELEAFHRATFGKEEEKRPAPAPAGAGLKDDAELIERAIKSKNGAMFSQLYGGDWSGYPSQSEADIAFCNLLAFWTGKDAEQMERIFRQSGLYRAKSDQRHYSSGETYLQYNINKAINDTPNIYEPRSNRPDSELSWDATIGDPDGAGEDSGIKQEVNEKTECPQSNAPPATKEKKSLSVVCMADVEPEEIDWLWYPYIPKGKITLLVGDPAAGKTFLSLAIAAAISTGNPLPDNIHGRPITRREPGTVIYMSAEDGIADTLRPRLDMLGGNPSNVHAVMGTMQDTQEGAFSFEDIALLDGYAQVIKPELIVCDPLHAFLGAKVDMHRANETRPVLSRLAALAEKHNCAVFCLEHMNKTGSPNALYRILGSIDFAAIARSVLLAGSSPDDRSDKAIMHVKSSLAPAGASQGYALEVGKGFYWTGLSELTTSKLLSHDKAKDKKISKLDEAIDWLREELTDGPKEAAIVKKLAQDDGISEKTLRRAREYLGIEPYKEQNVKHGKYYWKLPDLLSSSTEIGQVGQPDNLFSNDACSTVCPS